MKTIKKLNYISGTIFLSSLAGVLQAAEPQSKPNVIFFLCDDLGFSDIESYGNQLISTPNLNKLASEGMSFTQFYAASSVSAPSRAGLMTGQHIGHTKIRGNYEISPEGQAPIDPAVKIIPQLFKTAGYTTGIFGKWGLGHPGSGSEPTDMGFDTFYGYNCQRQSHSYYPMWLYRNKNKENLDGKSYSADLIHQEALKFIRDNKEQNFFMYAAYTLPHADLDQPNDSILQKYVGRFCETPTNGGGYKPTDKPRAQFAGMVTRLDTYVGELVAELKKQGLYDNTVFIFTSDNGPHTEGGADPNFFNTEKRLRGFKRSLYEGGVRVPFIAVWPNHIEANSINHSVAAGWDMLPTFRELLGKNESWTQETDGLSILPTLTNEGTQAQHDYLYFEFHEEGGRQMVRQGDWTLIRQKINSTNPILELYNINDDLHQDIELSAKYPDKVQELKNLMDNSRTQSPMFNFGK